MCKKLVILAKENVSRYIAQCEHGTIHLVWDNLSVRLYPEDLIRIVDQVQTAAGHPLGANQKRGFKIKMRELELTVQTEALTVLRDLMSLAVVQMEKPAGICGELKPPEMTLRKLGALSFSLN
jgi:hypothetical protein